MLVHHFQETDIDGGAGDIVDSTNKNNDATTANMNSADQIPGKIDGSIDFDGANGFKLSVPGNGEPKLGCSVLESPFGGNGEPIDGAGGKGELFSKGGNGEFIDPSIGGGKGELFSPSIPPIPGAIFGPELFGVVACSHTPVTSALQFGQIDSPNPISFPHSGQ